MSATYIVGDTSDVVRSGRLRELLMDTWGVPHADVVLTSPPFLALRSYLPDDHPHKHAEIGSEPTPAAFLSTLLGLTDDWLAHLAPHGSILVELGDTYSGSGGAGGDYNDGGLRDGQQAFTGSGRRARPPRATVRPNGHHRDSGAVANLGGPDWPLAKSLCGIPTLYPWSLAYGRNLLTGEPCAQLRIRNLLCWARPNPPVGALGDKFRPATSYVTVACPSARRWFDLDAVRGPGSPNTHARLARGSDPRPTNGKKADNPNNNFGSMHEVETDGAPPLDWHDDRDWQPLLGLPTAPYKGSHYATFPETLPRRLIDATCPRQVCRTCGEPRRRIVEQTNEEYARVRRAIDEAFKRPTRGANAGHTKDNPAGSLLGNGVVRPEYVTLGWTDCGCGAGWRPGIVLDPFAGSGTTLAVAVGLGRAAVGIDLDERNADLARERVGLFLNVEHHEGSAA